MQSSFESHLTKAWLRRGLLARLLWPLAMVYMLATTVRRALYAWGWRRSIRLPVPVIVVGNIFVGGTGKTPLTIWLVRELRQAGYRPGVISRGYGAAAHPTPHAAMVGGDPRLCGDEPLLIAEQAACPVMVGRRRVDAGRALLRAHPDIDVIVADDGLQHYALARDIEIVLFDSRGAGNGWPLPAGPLREPLHRRRDFTVVNTGSGDALKSDALLLGNGAMAMRLVGGEARQLLDESWRRPLSDFAVNSGAAFVGRIVAAAGIGNPDRFFAMLTRAGLHVSPMPLPDHYDFSANPFAVLSVDLILITEKDAVKCRVIEAIRNDPRVWVVPVTAHIDGPLAEHIVEKLRERPTA
ncbi:MAG: tetraacyldisaccharide 4-kinase [Herbaspirillum sp.]|nr:tetraacyldisaccharide 4-kinase [Herbaspirillum sp.]